MSRDISTRAFYFPDKFSITNIIMEENVVDVSEEVGDETENVEEKPKLSAAERLAAKKRFRTQRRLSTMKNKVLRNAQWATLKKEKRKVSQLRLTI